IYFTDVDRAVRKVDNAGIITTVAGNLSMAAGFSGDGGPATAAQLNGARDIAIDNANGNMYITDINNHVIRMVSIDLNAPHFVSGPSQTLSICQDSVNVPI